MRGGVSYMAAPCVPNQPYVMDKNKHYFIHFIPFGAKFYNHERTLCLSKKKIISQLNFQCHIPLYFNQFTFLDVRYESQSTGYIQSTATKKWLIHFLSHQIFPALNSTINHLIFHDELESNIFFSIHEIKLLEKFSC